MHRNPHQLIEGMLIAAYAAGITHAFIYIRGEYEEQADILDAAVTEAYAAATSARASSARASRAALVVHRGAGAYICGEETALLDSLEGKRGNPRLKPPFPANQGLYQGPTLINNVETLSNVPHIIEQRRGVVPQVRDRAVTRDEGRVGVRLTCSARATTRSSWASRRATSSTGSPAGRRDGTPRQGVVPGRLLGSRADGGAPRPALRLRAHGRGRVDARLRGDHRGRRLGADRVGRAAAGRVLPPRVLRQVRALPRGNELDREDARAHRPRRGDAHGPRRDGERAGATSSATACACSATRWRCRWRR